MPGLSPHLEPTNANWTQAYGGLGICLSVVVSDPIPRRISSAENKKLMTTRRIIIPIAFRIAKYDRAGLTTDPTFREVPFVIWTQVEMHFSLISATIPVLRPVILNLSTSYSSLGPKESPTSYANSAGTYKLSTLKPASRSARNGMLLSESNPDGSVDLEVFPSSSIQDRNVKSRNSLQTDSIGSHSSEQMIIRKQMSWRVESYEAGSSE